MGGREGEEGRGEGGPFDQNVQICRIGVFEKKIFTTSTQKKSMEIKTKKTKMKKEEKKK